MKVYRNEALSFKVSVPEEWHFPRFGATNSKAGKLIAFKCNYYERFEIRVKPITEGLSCQQIEESFREHSWKYDYSSFDMGRISIDGKEHVWARWYLGGGNWKKVYKIANSENQYEITAICMRQSKLLEREKIWDAVVASFRDSSAPLNHSSIPSNKQSMATESVPDSKRKQPSSPNVNASWNLKTVAEQHNPETEPTVEKYSSAEGEYAIEHPLSSKPKWPSFRKRAINQFYGSVKCHQNGKEIDAVTMYQEALKIDPDLHENAREMLSKMAQGCSATDEGAIYYWLGIHSEWLKDFAEAKISYEKAISAYLKIGYRNRASRACNNLGNVKMKMNDPLALDEFERAISFNPKNGIAHINIGAIYYRISKRGDPRFDKALDAFANAINVDLVTYGPLVLSRLRSIGYTWKEDWEDISRRVVTKPPSIDVESDDLLKKSEKSGDNQKNVIGFEATISVRKPKKTYRNNKHSFEIDIPEEWQPATLPIPKESAKDFFQYCCYDEAFNFEIGSLTPEPSLDQTERDFVQFAMIRGFSELKISRIKVGGKEHVCASYHILDDMGERWNKKYMIVFGGIEYAITATANDLKWFVQREGDWDEIVQSFCLLGKPML